MLTETRHIESLYSDPKATRVGDTLEIRVNEVTESSLSATTDLQRQSSLDLAVGGFLGLPSNRGIGNFLGSGNSFNPTIDSSYEHSQSSQGTTTRNGTMTAIIPAVVTKVYPNGNLEVKGEKIVTLNGEDQLMNITGRVRPVDINFDNTVDSTRIAHAEISIRGRGVLNDAIGVGWATRILGWVWPF